MLTFSNEVIRNSLLHFLEHIPLIYLSTKYTRKSLQEKCRRNSLILSKSISCIQLHLKQLLSGKLNIFLTELVSVGRQR